MPSEEHPTITLNYTGLFDFDGLYTTVTDWAKNYGYMWYEMSYKHKVPNVQTGAEQELDWIITKKVTNYISFKIFFQVHTWDQTEVEVEVDKRKKTLTSARIHLTMNGSVEYDQQSIFAKGKFAKKLGKWYISYIYKREMESYWDQLYYRMWNLHAILKKYFEMQTQKYAYKGYLKEH